MATRKSIPIAQSEWNGKLIPHRTDRINVKLRLIGRNPDEKRARAICDTLLDAVKGAKVLRFSPQTGRVVLEVPEGTDIATVARELSKHGDVVCAEPDQIGQITLVPSDTRYSEQWGYPKIAAEAAWDAETGDTGVLIGILDSGISFDGGVLTHPDLDDAGRFQLGTDFISDDALPQDGLGHGTHVAGTAAAESNNANGVAGMNWNSNVYICKVFDDGGNGSSSDVLSAVEEIVDHAVANNLRLVLNLSGRWLSDDTSLNDACAYAHNHGAVFCIATGNDSSTVMSPALHSADFAGVVAVGATDSSDAVAGFSNTGPEVTVVAPGVGILSTFPTYDVSLNGDRDFSTLDGTSMATPHVCGLASLVWSRVANLTNEQVRDVLMNTAVKLGVGDFDDSWGHGRINAADAVAKAGWELTPVQIALNFIDIPEGETQLRAIRIDVKSFHATSFEMSILPGAPFTMHNYSGPVTIGKTTEYDTPREVYLWVKYTGTAAGDTASGTAQVRCTTTGQVFDVTITANTIARPTVAMMLVLDKSGSMLDPSGVGTMTREQVLKYSTTIFLNYVRQNNGVGIVTFDHTTADLLNPAAGPFGAADDPFDTARSSAITAMGGYAANPMGNTAIGSGIERGHNNLVGVTGYNKTALIVFTDGHETASKYIADVAPLIDNQVFAVGLGTANQLNPAALDAICNSSGGQLLLTDQLDNDDTFKLAKYFLQIQAGVNNEDIVVDPNGYVGVGQTVKVPFVLNEADISADAIVLLPFQGLLQVAVETPQGDVIETGNVLSFPTVTRALGQNMTYYRMTLPVDDGVQVHAQTGTWNLLLRIDEKYFRRYLSSVKEQPQAYQDALAHGIRYTGLVHAYSNLRMRCTLQQNSYEPGAKLKLRAVLTEYGAPLPKSASVRAELVRPDGTSGMVTFAAVATGAYEAEVEANFAGIYNFVVKASGSTSRNSPFTREQVMTAAVWRGGDSPPPSTKTGDGTNPGRDAICGLIHCLEGALGEKGKAQVEEQFGISLDQLAACYCKDKAGPVIN